MKDAELLRQEVRYADSRIQEFCSRQVPAELFHYTLSQMRTIRMLYMLTRELPAGVQLKMLAGKLGVTPAAASEMVDTLVRKGAVIRNSDPADRRAVLLQVGEELSEKFDACDRKLSRLARNFLDTLSQEEVRTALSVAQKFSDFVSDDDNFPEE